MADTAPAAFIPNASAIRRALRRAADGVTLDATEAETLLHARGADLDRLLESAGRVRDAGLARAGRPGVITYSRKVFLPITHLCRDRCHYCVFVQTPGKLAKAGKSMFMSPDDIVEVARKGPRSAARRRCSPSATGPRSAGPRPASGWMRTAMTRPSTTSGPWRSGSWRRPGCSCT